MNWDQIVAGRAGGMAPFQVMEVLEAAQAIDRAGGDVVHLEIGEPDFDTPPVIRAAGERALAEGATHYTHSLGRWELREAIARHYYHTYGVSVSPERVIVTAGTSAALWLVAAALVEPGDEVLLGDPSYACYPNFICFFGGVPKYVPLDPANGYQFDLFNVRKAIRHRTKAILVNSPSNPTGTLLEPETMAGLAATGVPVVSDEIYHGLVYEGRERSMLEFSDDAIVLNGFSKAYAMTGWRLGYVIVPQALVRPIQKMVQNFFISPADFVQHAAVVALESAAEDVELMRTEYDRRRRRMIDGLRSVGFTIPFEPTGAFYILADARRWGNNSVDLSRRFLEDAGVATAPGSDFGASAEGFVRFSYAASIERIDEAIGRLRRYLSR